MTLRTHKRITPLCFWTVITATLLFERAGSYGWLIGSLAGVAGVLAIGLYFYSLWHPPEGEKDNPKQRPNSLQPQSAVHPHPSSTEVVYEFSFHLSSIKFGDSEYRETLSEVKVTLRPDKPHVDVDGIIELIRSALYLKTGTLHKQASPRSALLPREPALDAFEQLQTSDSESIN